MDFYYLALYFFVYSFLGWCTEVAFAGFKEHHFVNRGFLNGPFCPIYGFGVSMVIAFLAPCQSNLLLLYLASVILVTVLEGLTGWAMDKIFHNKWWDYSMMPFNIGGYVCLLFSLIWGVACVAIVRYIHPLIHKALSFLPHTLGIVLICVFGVLLIIDTYVTASAIFQFNRKLEYMEKIAAELHELSNQLGENIYDTVEGFHVKTLDAAEDLHEFHQDTVENLRELHQDTVENLHEHFLELKTHYADLKHGTDHNTRRLLRAFPRLESRKHKERLTEIRQYLKERFQQK